MRFAYINSQGKEVGIPSVEALQLRIELGAIVETTMFYDENGDRWAPAGDHDIFRTLQREIAAKEGGDFVAPPPPTLEPAIPVAEPPSSELETPTGAAPPEAETRTAPEPPAPAEAPAVPEAQEVEEKAEEDLGLEGLTLLAEEQEAGVEAGDKEPLDSSPDLETQFSDLGFELTTLQEETEEPKKPEESEEAEATSDASAAGPFDFGDFGAIEMEEPEEPEEPEATEAATPTGDMALEAPLGGQDFGGGSAVDESLQLETPMSEYSPERPPSWMDERDLEPTPPSPPRERPRRPERAVREGEEAVPAPSGAEAEGQGAAAGERPSPPRARPAPPQLKEKKGPVGAIAAVVVLLLVGGGGFFGWKMLRGGGASQETEPQRTYAVVEIPPIPAELETTFRSLADAALADWVERQRALPEAAGIPEQPPDEWLAGIYLSNASQYPNVAEYWKGMQDWLEGVRAGEEQSFRETFQARMDSAGVSGDDRETLLARAVAGFEAALPERDQAYDALAAVNEASLNLHDFLLEHEAEIEYTPAAGGLSADPVLEAVPATAGLGDEMWDMVDHITSALENMNALTDRVTTQRLIGLTLDQLASTTVH